MQRTCEECKEDIPYNRGVEAMFCSQNCKNKNWKNRGGNKDYHKDYHDNYYINLNRKAKAFFLKKNINKNN